MNSDQMLERWQASMGTPAPQQQEVPKQPKAITPGSLASDGSKKTVLLVDSNLRSSEARAKVLRGLGVRVDCVASPEAARTRLAAETYNLILVDPGHDTNAAESLVSEIRTKNSRQLVGFLVGSPMFIATSLPGAPSRWRRTPAPAIVRAAQEPSTPAASGADFGQKVRDAEAEQIA